MTARVSKHEQLLVTMVLGLFMAVASAAVALTRPESQQEYWAQFDRRDWQAATTAAEQLVAVARARAKQQPLQLVEALTLLGNAQLGRADYVSAESSFREALVLVEQNVGNASAQLLDPLRGLGYTLAAGGRHDEAVPHLDRALLIAHRSYGLFDVSQQGLLRQLAISLTRLGRPEEAERRMNYLMRVGERAYGARDPRFAATLSLVGSWYSEVGNFAPARLSYRNAMEIVAKKLGEQDLAMIEPLRGYARTYTQELFFNTLWIRTARPDNQLHTNADGTVEEFRPLNPRFLSTEGERALERAVAILDARPEVAKEVAVDTLLQAGDWFQIKHQPDKALPYYKRAWEIAHSAETLRTAQPLSFPVRLYYPTPQAAARNLRAPDELVDMRYVQVEFTVRSDGTVQDAKVTEQDASSRQANDTLEAVLAARYRPKFVDGAPIDAPGISHREVFRTRKPTPEDSKE